ncbi:hypothetical protein ACFL3G_13330, partial [Planctomycetota bacterium]
TDYYWRVDQNDGSTTRTGNIWHFITGIGSYPPGVENPDDFERYGRTTDWNPTEGGEGWAIVSDVNEAHIEPANGVDSSKCLRSIADDTSNAKVRWYGSAAASGVKVLSFDTLMDEGDYTNGDARVYPFFGSVGNGENWLVFKHNSSSTEMLIAARTSGLDLTEVNLPGELTDPNDYLDIWYTFQMEFNYTDQTVRGRFGTAGGTLNDWSSTVVMEANDAISSVFFNALNGNILIDNISLVDVPVVANPDDFERYDVTTNWNPTEGGEGWAIVANVNEAHIEDGNGPDSDRCLRSISNDNDNAQVRWYGSAAASGTKTLTFDTLMDEGDYTNGCARVFPFFGSAGNGENWLVFRREGATLDMSVAARDSDYNLTEVDLPGKLTDPNDYLDIWYTFEMEFDYSASTVRARFAPTGSAFNSWSDTVTMEYTDAIDNVFFNALNGNILIDNIGLE